MPNLVRRTEHINHEYYNISLHNVAYHVECILWVGQSWKGE